MKKMLLSLSALLLTAHLSHAAAPCQEDAMTRGDEQALQQDRAECSYLASLVQQRTALLCEQKPVIAALPVAEQGQRLNELNEKVRKIDQKMAVVLAITGTTQSNDTKQRGLINCACCLSCCF